VSYSWVDPHFAVLYARRVEERLAERLASRAPGHAACEASSLAKDRDSANADSRSR